jgi:hypothetical protein
VHLSVIVIITAVKVVFTSPRLLPMNLLLEWWYRFSLNDLAMFMDCTGVRLLHLHGASAVRYTPATHTVVSVASGGCKARGWVT